MTRRLKLLTGLSTIAATSALALAGCGGEGEGASEGEGARGGETAVHAEGEGEGAAPAPSPTPIATASGEGEGGVDIAAAATDAVVFRSALAIAEAHVLAARDAYAAGRKEEAAGMFAHPVSEVLADMEGAFKARGVAPFNDLFIDASQGALNDETPARIAARTETIIAALDKAASLAPDDPRPAGAIAAGVVSDQIDRAVDMYRLAAASDDYGHYLDGYGFFKAARNVFARNRAVIGKDAPDAAKTIEAALSALAGAYPQADAPASIDADVAALSAASSRVMLSLGR